MRLFSIVILSLFALNTFGDEPKTPTTAEQRLGRIKWLVSYQDSPDRILAEKKAAAALDIAQKALNDVDKVYQTSKKEFDRLTAKKAKEADKFPAAERASLADLKKDLEEGEDSLTKKLARVQAKLEAASKDYDLALTAKNSVPDIAKVEEIEKALGTMALRDDFDKLDLKSLKAELKIAALVAKLDGAILGTYVQEKMEGLLGSGEFCAATKACTPEGKPGPAPSLKGLFDKKTHGAGK